MKKLLFIIFGFIFFWSCSPGIKNNATSTSEDISKSEKLSIPHFKIKDSLTYQIIEVREPFLNSGVQERYLLYPKGSEIPQNISATAKIAVPVNRVAINSTTHLGFLNAINRSKSIVAVTNPKLYYDTLFTARIKNGDVSSIGERTLNHEKLIESDVDLVFSFAIDAASFQEVQKLRDLGQNVVLISEYMEQDPLVKAEWLKVFAAFYGKVEQQVADSIYKTVQENYHQIRMNAMLYSYHPSVTIGLPWKGTWYVSGGESFQASLIRDANAGYLWQNYKQTASVPLDIETALSKGLGADFWINPGTLQAKDQLVVQHPNFKDFKAFTTDRVYTNYLQSNEFGANAYWESAVVRPDLLLKDLVTIFHDQSPDSLTYYKKLQ